VCLRVLLRRRVGDLFSDKTVSSRLVSMARKSVKGVENVYTQHTPLLATTLVCTMKVFRIAPVVVGMTTPLIVGQLLMQVSCSSAVCFERVDVSISQEAVARGRLPHMDYPYVGGAETSPTAAKVSPAFLTLCARLVVVCNTTNTVNPILGHTLMTSWLLLASRMSCLRMPIARPPVHHVQAPRLVVAFIVGGTTYEEARCVAEANAAGERGQGWAAGMRVILGGTGVQTSASFMRDVREMMNNERQTR